jgi:hypothetical protein
MVRWRFDEPRGEIMIGPRDFGSFLKAIKFISQEFPQYVLSI